MKRAKVAIMNKIILFAFALVMVGALPASASIVTAPQTTPAEIAAMCPFVDIDSPAAEMVPYDSHQPGADVTEVKQGFEAFKLGAFKTAYDIWGPLAASGNASAQYHLGLLFYGDGTNDDTISCANAWYLTSAAQGHLDAIAGLGLLKGSGDHQFIDRAQSLNLLLFAAERCHLGAQFQLGSFYGRTPAPQRDFVEAHKWLMVATARGHEEAKDINKILRRFTSVAELREGNRRHKEWIKEHDCE